MDLEMYGFSVPVKVLAIEENQRILCRMARRGCPHDHRMDLYCSTG